MNNLLSFSQIISQYKILLKESKKKNPGIKEVSTHSFSPSLHSSYTNWLFHKHTHIASVRFAINIIYQATEKATATLIDLDKANINAVSLRS